MPKLPERRVVELRSFGAARAAGGGTLVDAFFRSGCLAGFCDVPRSRHLTPWGVLAIVDDTSNCLTLPIRQRSSKKF